METSCSRSKINPEPESAEAQQSPTNSYGGTLIYTSWDLTC